MVTYRLADALPREVVRECEALKGDEARRHLEQHLDAGYGTRILVRPIVARLVIENWRHFDGERYHLIDWVVMPNHVHVVLETIDGHSLSTIVHSWKSYTAKRIAWRGRLWQADYWDRFIRDQVHLDAASSYVVNNPVSAGLCRRPQDWPWSSASASGEEQEE
jgi:putative transposase